MVSHLIEIRRRLIRIVLVLFILFFFLFYYADFLFHIVVKPLLSAFPGHQLIATQITTAVFVPINLALDTAFLMTMPYVLWQIWSFVSPGLYHKERNRLKFVMVISLILFIAGVLFCYYIVLPMILHFFAEAPKDIQLMPDITYALNFVTRMLLLFGISFQVPLICYVLVTVKWLNVNKLKKIRPYVIVTAFILGMLLTPPDVLSNLC